MKKFNIFLSGLSAGLMILTISSFPVSGSEIKASAQNTVKNYGEFTFTTVKDETCLAEQYKKENRDFAAMATVEITGDRLWSAWMSGGDKEPHNDNYIIVAYSDDYGDTWADPYLILDDTSAGRTRDPVLWYAPTGELYLFFGGNSGTKLVKFYNPEENVEDISYSEVVIPFSGTILNKPIVTSKGEWICSADPYDSSNAYRTEYVYASVDEGKSWVKRGVIESKAETKRYHEGTIVEKNDGTLWVLSRIENGNGGGIERSYSTDDGLTWSTFEAGLPKPFIGPGSKCAVRKLKNGGLLFVSNRSTSARIDMTAYYSGDDGATWSSLLLDSRSGDSAYPDIAEGDDGTIYVIWDHSRSVKCEIRLARFTVSDVISGAFESENSGRPYVSKRSGYFDITGVNTPYERVIDLVRGDPTTKEDILSSLPTAISVTLEDGSLRTVIGKWTTNWFSADYAGTYRFVFVPGNGDSQLQDRGDYFTVRVIVSELTEEPKASSGCASLLGGSVSLLSAGVGIDGVKRKRRKKF